MIGCRGERHEQNRAVREVFPVTQKILIVDDLEQNRVLLRDVLAYYGFESLLAADGVEGVAMAREHRPDLILMDMVMPVMDGLTAAKLLKQDPLTKDIKVIAITSFAPGENMQQCQEAGFVDLIPKPFAIKDIPEIIKKHLS